MVLFLLAIALGIFFGFNFSVYWRIRDIGMERVGAFLCTFAMYLFPYFAINSFFRIKKNRNGELYNKRDFLKTLTQEQYEKFLLILNSDIKLFIMIVSPLFSLKNISNIAVSIAQEIYQEQKGHVGVDNISVKYNNLDGVFNFISKNNMKLL